MYINVQLLCCVWWQTNQAGRKVHDRVGLTVKEGVSALLIGECPQMSCVKRNYKLQYTVTYICVCCTKTKTGWTLPASARWALLLSLSVGRRKSSKPFLTSGLVKASRSSVSRQWDGPIRLQIKSRTSLTSDCFDNFTLYTGHFLFNVYSTPKVPKG